MMPATATTTCGAVSGMGDLASACRSPKAPLDPLALQHHNHRAVTLFSEPVRLYTVAVVRDMNLQVTTSTFNVNKQFASSASD